MRWGSTWSVGGLAVAVCLAGAGPAAGATVVRVTKVCYHEREPVVFSAFGYTPGGLADIRLDGLGVTSLPVQANGATVGDVSAPIIDPTRVRPFALSATDRVNPSLFAQVTPLVSMLDVKVRPTGGRPNRLRRIDARGFTSGTKLYVHVRRHGRGRTVGLGTMQQPCGTRSVRKRIFRRDTARGTYKVQFDAFKRYKATRTPRVTFRVRIIPVFRTSSAFAHAASLNSPALALDERWVRVG